MHETVSTVSSVRHNGCQWGSEQPPPAPTGAVREDHCRADLAAPGPSPQAVSVTAADDADGADANVGFRCGRALPALGNSRPRRARGIVVPRPDRGIPRNRVFTGARKITEYFEEKLVEILHDTHFRKTKLRSGDTRLACARNARSSASHDHGSVWTALRRRNSAIRGLELMRPSGR